jgi:proteasome lid subunit RPN8/RPN11
MTVPKPRLSKTSESVNPVSPVHIWKTPPASGVELLIVTHLDVYTAIRRHSTRSLPRETGGFLLGRVSQDQESHCWHLEIDEAIQIHPVENNAVHFSFTWREVDQVRRRRDNQGKALIGWYHTHLDMGVYLSDTDLEKTHRVLFSEPFQVALVYDPVRCRAGYFFWERPQQIDTLSADWREFEI